MGVSSETKNALWNTLFDTGSGGLIETAGALSVAEGRCKDRLVRVALTDRSISGGSFGVDECNALSRHLARSIEDSMPVVLVLDSGGARLDAGLAGLAAFRRLYRTALDLRMTGVPMTAFMLRNCFGGASMLAMLCATRGALRTARIGMSGPGIIEALSGKTDLDSSDDAAVRALFGAPARAESGAIDHIFDEHGSLADALRCLVGNTAHAQPDIREQHDRLGQRLRRAGVDLSGGKETSAGAAFHNGVPVGALDIWLLADEVISEPVGQSMTLIVDCPGQAATRFDESMVLSEFVAHLALCLRSHSAGGSEIVVHVSGESAGGIYVALAAGANRVDASPQSTVRVLPVTAVQTVLSRTVPDEPLERALELGVVDRVTSGGGDAASDRNKRPAGFIDGN